MVALYREIIFVMFVNFAKNILNYINTNCSFSKKILDTPSYCTLILLSAKSGLQTCQNRAQKCI